MVEAIEPSLVLDGQVYSMEVYKKFNNPSKVLGNGVMENSVAIRILSTYNFHEITCIPGAVKSKCLETHFACYET